MTIFIWLGIGGTVLLLISWFITAILQTPWSEWKKDQDTKRREPQTWKRDPFKKIR